MQFCTYFCINEDWSLWIVNLLNARGLLRLQHEGSGIDT